MHTRNEIRETVLKHMRLNVTGLECDVIDSTKSMLDYGANSLDLMEIVSATLRDLSIKVPRTELATLNTIEDLVELLFRRQAPPPAPLQQKQ